MPNNNETYITGLRVVKGRKKSQCLNLSNARIKSYAEIEQMTEDELQGVIICPDYPLEDGHLVPASAIGYEDGTVEDALDDLNTKIGDWNVYKTGEATSQSTPVALPANFNELLIYVKGSGQVNGSFVISKHILSVSELLFRSGYYETAQYNGNCVLWISNTTVRASVSVEGSTVSATLDIYYR